MMYERAVSDVVIVGAGMIVNFQTVQTYVIDAFTLHAASGTSCSGHRLLRDPFDLRVTLNH